MTDRGYRISNVDVTLICERPKVNVEHNGRKVALTLNLPLPLPLILTLTLTPTLKPCSNQGRPWSTTGARSTL